MIKSCSECTETCDKPHDREFLLSITGKRDFCLMCGAQRELLEEMGISTDCKNCPSWEVQC